MNKTDGIHFDDARGPDDIRIYAIGDVHGRLDLLEKMHAHILGEIARDKPADWRMIHLGDYVDRGPDSRGVIELLMDACKRDSRIVALIGNHDLGFMEFLARPEMDSLFMQYGGVETAASYGVTFGPPLHRDLNRFHAELKRVVPAEHVRFIMSRPLSAAFGDFFFCHAGIRPRVPLDRQQLDDLIWIRNEFLRFSGLHPKVIVHGHTITRQPDLLANRVNIDTGAFQSGRLTAIAIDGAQKRLVSVEMERNK